MGGRQGRRNAQAPRGAARDRAPPRVDPVSIFKCVLCTLKNGMYKQSFIDSHKVACKGGLKLEQSKQSEHKEKQDRVIKAHGKPKKKKQNK